ncbi:MAG: signal peptidase I [Vicinamibacterales bacterium]
MLFASVSVLAAVCLAYYSQREFLPSLGLRTLWSPYFFAPMGWLAAAAVAGYWVRRIPATAVNEDSETDLRTILAISLVLGFFIVSLHFITGMLAGFGQSPYAHSPRWLATNLLFAGAPLLASEMSRTVLLRIGRRYGLTLALIGTSLGFAAIQFGESQFTRDGFVAQAEFWGASFIPAAAMGLLAGFFALYGGWRAALFVSAPLVAFTYFSPILPAAEWPILALVGVAGPAMGLWIAESMFETDKSEPETEQGWLRTPSVAWVLTAVMGLVIFWFSFGFFGYLPAFVPSHSMEPLIQQGDIVLTKDIKPEDIQVGDIILYEMPNRQRVLHRVMEIGTSETGSRYFIFKGDNNATEDGFPVTDDQIKSRYLFRVPKLGWIPIKFQSALMELK